MILLPPGSHLEQPWDGRYLEFVYVPVTCADPNENPEAFTNCDAWRFSGDLSGDAVTSFTSEIDALTCEGEPCACPGTEPCEVRVDRVPTTFERVVAPFDSASWEDVELVYGG